jgi:hypothetical protein
MTCDTYPWNAYAQTHVEAHLPNGEIKTLAQVDGEVGQWPFTEQQVWILTACNPRSVQLTSSENANRHKALGKQLNEMGLTHFYTLGFDPNDTSENQWKEDGYAVVGDHGFAVLELAELWEQNAVFLWEPTKWTILGVLEEGECTSGWCYV